MSNFQTLRLMFNFFCIHYYFFQREREHIYIDRVKDKNIFESGYKRIKFLSTLIKMKIFLSISYRKIIK